MQKLNYYFFIATTVLSDLFAINHNNCIFSNWSPNFSLNCLKCSSICNGKLFDSSLLFLSFIVQTITPSFLKQGITVANIGNTSLTLIWAISQTYNFYQQIIQWNFHTIISYGPCSSNWGKTFSALSFIWIMFSVIGIVRSPGSTATTFPCGTFSLKNYKKLNNVKIFIIYFGPSARGSTQIYYFPIGLKWLSNCFWSVENFSNFIVGWTFYLENSAKNRKTNLDLLVNQQWTNLRLSHRKVPRGLR